MAQKTTEDFRIVAGSYERILYGIDGYWSGDSITLQPVFIFPAHIGCIKCVGVGGQFLASGSTDEFIKLYDLKRRKELGHLNQQQGTITSLRFYGKSHMLSGSEDGTVCIWRTKDWECLKTMKGHKGRVNSISVHPSGKLALSVSNDRTLRMWNLLNGHKGTATKLGREGEVIEWNKDGQQYAILYAREIEVYNAADAEAVQKFENRSRFTSMKYYQHAGEDYIIAGSEDRVIRIYSVSSGELLASLKGHSSRIKDLTIIESLKSQSDAASIPLIISISSDGMMKVWNLSEILKGVQEKIDVFSSIGEYNAQVRLTCVDAVLGYKYKPISKKEELNQSNDEEEGSEAEEENSDEEAEEEEEEEEEE
ncbi:WD40 repeat-like protein [Basidiobolus meristosporus CBS 931.73]|uniref:WD40 repeat-like protein n=1 Tax=Basidiobolus meristosporus CBS 931.73 TaxID=1314790 RepID=A0A1Y1XYD2_9FUNG|nr:WD40 repeat-like protein [Basidiobolus meristosporus CBS 931.73]|eukprot:ORX90749.1 WD40 repeat-like protein [Basidiobolus meristosporus CBS 931.73]